MQHEGVRFQSENWNMQALLMLNVTCQEKIMRQGMAFLSVQKSEKVFKNKVNFSKMFQLSTIGLK